MSNSNSSLFDGSTGNCALCNRDKNRCACYGKPKADAAMLMSDSSDIGELLTECRGLHYGNIAASSLSIPSLQLVPFIPIITGGSERLFMTSSSTPYVGITLTDALNHAKTHALLDIRKSCHVPSDSKVILLMHGNDVVLEKFSKHQRTIYKELAQQDIHIFVAPNFSVWKNHPDIEQLIDMKLQLVSYDLMNKAGLRTVPHFHWRADHHEDLVKIATWLNERKSVVDTVAINLQTYRTPGEWREVIGELRTLHKLLDHRIHFIIIGPSTDKRITELIKILDDNFTLMSAQPAILAWSRSDIVCSGNHIRKRIYARNSKDQMSLFATVYPPNKPLIVAELFSGSSLALSSRILQTRSPDVIAQAKAAITSGSFRSQRLFHRSSPSTRHQTVKYQTPRIPR